MSKILLTVMCVLALGLAACGGSGKKAVASLVDTAAEQRAAVVKAIREATDAVAALDGESTDPEVTAAAEAIAAARKAVTDADTLSGEEKDGFGRLISSLDRSLEDKRSLIATAREDRRKSAAADVEKLFSALDRPGIADVRVTVRHGAAPTMSGTVLGTPPTSVAGLKTAGATGQLGGWSGGTYTAADESAGTADTVVLYTNIEASGMQPFSGEGGKYGTANGLDVDGNLPITADTDATLIASSAFPTGPGIRTHEAGTDGTARIAGSFDGASGAYVCAPATDSACTSSVKHGGGYTLAGGSWKFEPATGAMAATIDAEYQYFGWWQRQTGDSFAVGAFHAGDGGAADEFAGLAALQGQATYRGPAVGKVAIQPLVGEGSAGDFTATATLEVDFGDATVEGTVEGTVRGFRVNGVSEPSWSVRLRTARIGAGGSIAAGGSNTAGTVWSIDGNAAASSSSAWRGQFHEVGDDRVPAAATGTFEASYDDVGRMTGAFGTTQ
ncbi:MAG: hypothetical protein OXC14_12940 [Rhodospirillaceae bacterium]|nr:hypothetical protein [Rhodospirillaceae bacterium]